MVGCGAEMSQAILFWTEGAQQAAIDIGAALGAFQGGDGLGKVPAVHFDGNFRNRNCGRRCQAEQVFNQLPGILPEMSGIGLSVPESKHPQFVDRAAKLRFHQFL